MRFSKIFLVSMKLFLVRWLLSRYSTMSLKMSLDFTCRAELYDFLEFSGLSWLYFDGISYLGGSYCCGSYLCSYFASYLCS